MSTRLRLTLSYVGFLLVAELGLVALLVYIIRFVPEGNLSDAGVFIPDRNDLLTALWPRVWMVVAGLALVGILGGWFLAHRMLKLNCPRFCAASF